MPTYLESASGLLVPDRPQKAVVTGNGGTGPGVIAYYNDVPLWKAATNPRRLMRQAQELYHRDLIIRACEHRVSSALAGLEWHLEDENDDEILDDGDASAVAIRDWLAKPQAQLVDRKKMTRRALWQITSRHAGLCGTSFWYLDQRTIGDGSPLVSLYINPARMYPVENERGILLGWKLDSDEEGNGGIPLELEEVLQFDFDPPDIGHYGIGLVESAWGAAGVSRAIESHEQQVFSGGARLAGIISPKVGATVSDDQWLAAVKDWRNISSDPESAKRLHILRGPVDFTRTAATMQELAVETISGMTREDKLALWGVPMSQLPLPVAAGMNSGETKAFDEAVFYQGAVHDRVLVISEVIQAQVLDRIALAGGPTLTLVVEEPEFDDTTPLFERALKAIDQPLTVNERREILGKDPIPDVDSAGEPLGTAIWLPSKLTLAMAGPDENGNLIALPEPEPQPVALLAPPSEEPVEAAPVKAETDKLLGLRKTVDTRYVDSTKRDVRKALADQAKATARRVRSRGHAVSPDKPGTWWDEDVEDARMRKAIEPHNVAIADVVTEKIRDTLGPKPQKADTFEDEVADFIRERTGERVKGINQTTREAISRIIADGFADGLGPSEVADAIEQATAFDEARAELVARTESMLAYNEAALSSYRSYDIGRVTAIDGDGDPECAARNGRTFSVDDAFSIADHPNGTLDWVPIVA